MNKKSIKKSNKNYQVEISILKKLTEIGDYHFYGFVFLRIKTTRINITKLLGETRVLTKNSYKIKI